MAGTPIRTLSDDELATYHEQGFVVVDDVFPRDELMEMNRELDRVVEERRAKAGTQDGNRGWLFKLGLATDKTKAFCEDPRILDLVEPIVQPGVAIFSAKLVSKEPKDDGICHWHQDDAFYQDDSESRTRMSVWIPLQNTSVEQGCLEVIPGSHKRGLQPWSKREWGTCVRGIDSEIDLDERVYCPLNAGSMLLFSALLYHGSAGNRTDSLRRAFIISYQEATAQGGNADQWKVLRAA